MKLWNTSPRHELVYKLLYSDFRYFWKNNSFMEKRYEKCDLWEIVLETVVYFILRPNLFILWKVVLWLKIIFKIFLCLFIIRKINQRKTLSNKKIFDLIFRKVFFFDFERKTLFRNYKKIRNIILFADYIKFDPQTFDCYILYFESFFFQFHPLEFDLI
jgi:hypothetical protein